MKKLILTLAFLGMTIGGYPMSKNNFDVRQEIGTVNRIYNIMEVLKMVESLGDHKAVSPKGTYLGILQIGKQCIREVNRLYGTSYIHHDALNVDKSEDIFLKVITAGVTNFKTRYKRSPSDEDIVRMWNGGIYNGYKAPSTKKYYNKYLRYKAKYF